MTRLITHITMGALVGAVMGAVALFILAEGLPEGAIAGALIGASVGALMAARIHAHRAAIAIAKRGPEGSPAPGATARCPQRCAIARAPSHERIPGSRLS